MLEFNHDYIENYIDITDFEWSEANTVGNYFAFSENGINLIGPELRNWKEKRKEKFRYHNNNKMHSLFNVDNIIVYFEGL